jgi:hypothetical protein
VSLLAERPSLGAQILQRPVEQLHRSRAYALGVRPDRGRRRRSSPPRAHRR